MRKSMVINNLARVTEVSDDKSTWILGRYREYHAPGCDVMYPSISSTFRKYVLHPSSGSKNAKEARRPCALCC
jgi:hypothetical protein